MLTNRQSSIDATMTEDGPQSQNLATGGNKSSDEEIKVGDEDKKEDLRKRLVKTKD